MAVANNVQCGEAPPPWPIERRLAAASLAPKPIAEEDESSALLSYQLVQPANVACLFFDLFSCAGPCARIHQGAGTTNLAVPSANDRAPAPQCEARVVGEKAAAATTTHRGQPGPGCDWLNWRSQGAALCVWIDVVDTLGAVQFPR